MVSRSFCTRRAHLRPNRDRRRLNALRMTLRRMLSFNKITGGWLFADGKQTGAHIRALWHMEQLASVTRYDDWSRTRTRTLPPVWQLVTDFIDRRQVWLTSCSLTGWRRVFNDRNRNLSYELWLIMTKRNSDVDWRCRLKHSRIVIN